MFDGGAYLPRVDGFLDAGAEFARVLPFGVQNFHLKTVGMVPPPNVDLKLDGHALKSSTLSCRRRAFRDFQRMTRRWPSFFCRGPTMIGPGVNRLDGWTTNGFMASF